MLTCVPESWSNWNFDITGTSADPARTTLAGNTLAGQTLAGITDYGTILFGGDVFVVKKQGLLTPIWELKAGSKVGATGQKSLGISPIGWRPSFEVQAGDLCITLETQRLSSLQYNILLSSNIVGTIARKGRWFPKWPAFVECTVEVPELVQLFCFWLAMQSWRQAGSGY
jgi:hypothetical protein